MKTLQLSTILFVLVSLFSSCTKDSSISLDSSLSAAASRTTVLGGGNNNNPGGGGGDKKPVLTPTQSPAPVAVGNSVTVTYAATDAASGASVSCGKIIIYRWNNATSAWDQVSEGAAPTASFTFTPTTADDCAYKFRAGFAPGGGTQNCQGAYAGVDHLAGTDFCADVINPCVSVFTIGHNVTAAKYGQWFVRVYGNLHAYQP